MMLLPSHSATRSQRDGLHLAAGALEIVVDDRKIVARKLEHFLPRAFQAAVNFVLGILPAGAYALFDVRARRRDDEDRDGLGELLFYLQRSGDIDCENQILAFS